ncbi:hypothetical protein PQO03_16475 [Lentisphaera profundi]|uniref:Uncharacterized protein n=1 Tax=Lentisphaera profundi TaxID=1658616 RepID=A0ABY7W1I9_9BACT|nr:hypothetical protein [Lentisphaera profundi]WDE99434.1 hypothetical protein PQO03_16475 [Lentisphaera profundi]
MVNTSGGRGALGALLKKVAVRIKILKFPLISGQARIPTMLNQENN